MSYRGTPAERLWRRTVERENGCHEWTGYTDPKGYGIISYRGWMIGTHRLAWILVNGPIPDGMFICHHCDNPPCGNPDHLFLGTNADNMADMAAKGRHVSPNGNKTRCKHGHPFNKKNTYVRPKGDGRDCKECRRTQAKTRWAESR